MSWDSEVEEYLEIVRRGNYLRNYIVLKAAESIAREIEEEAGG